MTADASFLANAIRNLRQHAERLQGQPRILDIPGGFIEVPYGADEDTLNEAARLFVRGRQIGARALCEEVR